MATAEDKKTKAIEKIEKAAKKGFGKGLTEPIIEDAVSRGIKRAKNKAEKDKSRPIQFRSQRRKSRLLHRNSTPSDFSNEDLPSNLRQ